MFKHTKNNLKVGIFFIDSVIVSIILILNAYLRINVPDSIKQYGNINKYYKYLDLLTFITILSILVTLLTSIYFLQRERANVTRRLDLLVSLFKESRIVPIQNDNSILTEYDLQVINAWNKSVEEITMQKELREKYFNYIVHDLKTPIQILKSNLQMHELDYGESEYIVSIREELTKLEHSIRNYLVIEKISYFEKVQKEDMELITFFSLISERYEKLGFTIHIKFENTAKYFNIDRSMFSKVVENLIENAMKHGIDKQMWITVYDHKIEFINKLQQLPAKEDLFCENVRHYSKIGNGLGIQIIKTYVELMELQIGSKCAGDKLIVTLSLQSPNSGN